MFYWTLSQFAFFVLLFCCHAAAAQSSIAESAPVALRNLLPSTDKLAQHDLSFDTSFARQAIEYLRSNDPHLMERMADSPAVTHILNQLAEPGRVLHSTGGDGCACRIPATSERSCAGG